MASFFPVTGRQSPGVLQNIIRPSLGNVVGGSTKNPMLPRSAPLSLGRCIIGYNFLYSFKFPLKKTEYAHHASFIGKCCKWMLQSMPGIVLESPLSDRAQGPGPGSYETNHVASIQHCVEIKSRNPSSMFVNPIPEAQRCCLLRGLHSPIHSHSARNFFNWRGAALSLIDKMEYHAQQANQHQVQVHILLKHLEAFYRTGAHLRLSAKFRRLGECMSMYQVLLSTTHQGKSERASYWMHGRDLFHHYDP